jgi:hypothetical protein
MSGELVEIPISGDPSRGMLDSDGSMLGICHLFSGGLRFTAELSK